MVRTYNETAEMLLEFEVLQHQTWMKEISLLEYGWSKWGTAALRVSLCRYLLEMLFLFFITVLNHTLLVRHPRTGKLVDNFDPKVHEVIREAKCLGALNLQVPKQALVLVNRESKLNGYHLHLKVILKAFYNVLYIWVSYTSVI